MWTVNTSNEFVSSWEMLKRAVAVKERMENDKKNDGQST